MATEAGAAGALAPHLAAWERDYARRGALWRARGDPIPQMQSGWKVLELGCGNGKTTATLSLQPGVELHAIDSSPTAVEMCGECVKKAGGKGDVAVADGLHLPYADSFFDAVVAFHYFAHMPSEDSEKARAEAVRVLKPGGKLFFKEFGTGDFRYGKGTETEPGTFRRRGGILTHYYTEGEAKGLFSSLRLERFEFERWKVLLQGKEYARERVHADFSKPPEERK